MLEGERRSKPAHVWRIRVARFAATGVATVGLLAANLATDATSDLVAFAKHHVPFRHHKAAAYKVVTVPVTPPPVAQPPANAPGR